METEKNMKEFFTFAKYNAFAGVFIFLFLTIESLIVSNNYSFRNILINAGLSVICLIVFYFMGREYEKK